jgi:hypothetical protein
MEKLGYDSPLAETTRVFQAMDPSSSGSVGLQAFLAVFVEDSDDSRLSAKSLSSTTGPDSAGGVSAGLASLDEDALSKNDLDIIARVSRIESRMESEISRVREFCERASVRHAELLESRCLDMEREVSRFSEQLDGRCSRHTEQLEEHCSRYADQIERRYGQLAELLEAKYMDLERANARQAELQDAKCLEKCASISEELTSKLEDLRLELKANFDNALAQSEARWESRVTEEVKAVTQHAELLRRDFEQRVDLAEKKFHDAELANAQQLVELRTATAKLDTSSEDVHRGLVLSLQREVKDDMDLLKSNLEGRLAALRSEIRSAPPAEDKPKSPRLPSCSPPELDAKLQALRKEIFTTLQEKDAKFFSFRAEILKAFAEEIQERANGTSDKQGPDRYPSDDPRVEERFQGFRADMRAAFEEERNASIERTRAVGKTLSEELGSRILAQASASARSEAISISCSVLTKEMEAFQKHWVNEQSELVARINVKLVEISDRLLRNEDCCRKLQLSEQPPRPLTEENIKNLELTEVVEAQLNAAKEAELQVTQRSGAFAEAPVKDCPGSDNPMVLFSPQEMQPSLQHTLKAIIEKLDNQCIETLAPDLKELNSLLEGKEDHTDPLMNTQSTAEVDLRAGLTRYRQASPHDSEKDSHSDRGSSGQGGGEITKLRQDILGYLRSDFHQMVSTTLKDLKKSEAEARGDSTDRSKHARTVSPRSPSFNRVGSGGLQVRQRSHGPSGAPTSYANAASSDPNNRNTLQKPAPLSVRGRGTPLAKFAERAPAEQRQQSPPAAQSGLLPESFLPQRKSTYMTQGDSAERVRSPRLESVESAPSGLSLQYSRSGSLPHGRDISAGGTPRMQTGVPVQPASQTGAAASGSFTGPGSNLSQSAPNNPRVSVNSWSSVAQAGSPQGQSLRAPRGIPLHSKQIPTNRGSVAREASMPSHTSPRPPVLGPAPLG